MKNQFYTQNKGINILQATLLLFTLTLFSHTVEAQASFEGSLSYAIRLTGKQAQEFLVNEPATKMDVHIKADNFIINLSGGRIPRTFLFVGDSNHTYIVDAANRRAFLRTYYIPDSNAVVPTAKPTGNTKMINGTECQEYKVVKPKRKEIILYYVNDQYRVDPHLFEDKDEAKADFLTKGLDGRIPFMKIIKTPGLTTELELKLIKSRDLDIENFRIPHGFKIKKRDPRK